MIVKKPSILIYMNQPDEHILKEICAGMEEEGLFFEIQERRETDYHLLARQAAESSMTGSGVGISGRSCGFSMRGFSGQGCVESYENPTPEESRRLGGNSARAVKKQAFR